MRKCSRRDLVLFGLCVLLFIGAAVLANVIMPVPEGMIA